MTGLHELELTGVAAAMAAVGVKTGELTATPIAGGRSNLTYRLSDGAHNWVLRTPPRSGRTPSAHDVGREYRVTAALAATSRVPVARPILHVEDEGLLGGPFTVVEHVTGTTVRTATELDRLDDATVERVLDELVETLALLHTCDVEAVGLSGLGRSDGYAERQLRRWRAQWDLVGDASLKPAARELVGRLERHLPRQRATSVVHGDYRMDNTLLRLDPDVAVAAVVDWELSTLGDPVADVALMCGYRNPAFNLIVGESSAWTSPRLPTADELAERYERASGVEIVDWPAHLALASFKIAVIAAGIAHRRRTGASTGANEAIDGAAVAFLEAGLAALPAELNSPISRG